MQISEVLHANHTQWEFINLYLGIFEILYIYIKINKQEHYNYVLHKTNLENDLTQRSHIT